jgi:hypothetical protein
MSDPDYRYCTYCKCDCDDFPGAKPDHAEDCPDVTGLFPVSVKDIREHLQCLDCSEPFKPGDYYVQVREEHDIADIVCLGCGMLESIANGG